jgi:hypothetical protein
MPTIGSNAPAFCLPSPEKGTVCLKDFSSKWVVLYFSKNSSIVPIRSLKSISISLSARGASPLP